MNADPPREETVLEQALNYTSAEARHAYLQGACGNDEQLRARVESLIEAHEAAGGFLGVKTTEKVPTLHSENPLTEGPGTVIDRYKLLEKLGEGGFGAVYVAEQREPVKRRVALKIIKLGMDTKQVVARFEAERQALALMDHPNIAKVLDAGATKTGRPYFVMELVKGVPMTKYCDQERLETEARLDLFIKVCHAIQHAHQKGIIHRDIKPSNILVTLHDGVPVPKVIDFGIAKATQGELTDKTIYTQFQQFIGTPAYMSPEQAEMSGLDIDTRSDIYSLGVLLYELLTGSTPFDTKELMQSGLDEMRKIIREREPVRPSTRLTQLQGDPKSKIQHPKSKIENDLDWIVMKCLEKDRTRRYETANGLAMDINRHLKQEPIVACPPRAAYRFRKLVQRNKLAFAAAGAVVLALLLGVIVSAWQAVQATRARNEAKESERKAEQARANENQERHRAEANAAESQQNFLRAEQNSILLKIQRAEDFFGAEDAASALAYLSQVLRQSPTNRVAAQRLLSALTQRNFPLLATEPLKHNDMIHFAEFSPDGLLVVTASADGTARVWDAGTGKPVTPPLRHNEAVITARFSPDGKRVVTGSFDKTSRVWDALDGRALAGPLQHNYPVFSARFSPDGRKVLTAAGYDPVFIWDSNTGQQLAQPMRHSNGLTSAIFSPDGQQVLTASADNTARIWEAASGRLITTLTNHEGFVLSAEFSPNGDRVVTSSMDNTARVWDAKTGQPITPALQHETWVTYATFSRDGLRVATHSRDNTARMWDAQSGQPLTHPFRYRAEVLSPTSMTMRRRHSIHFTLEGLGILTPNWDNTACLWDSLKGRPMAEPLRQGREIFSAQFSPNGQQVITASADHTARIWDVRVGQMLTEPLCHNSEVTVAQFSPDGQRVITASEDRTAWIWDVRTGLPIIGPLKHDDFVLAVQFSADGEKVATASYDHTARVWSARTGHPLTGLLWHDDVVRSLQFSRDGRKVITASDDGTARLWDVISGKSLVAPLRHGTNVAFATFSPEGNRVVTASGDKTARLWDAGSGAALSKPLAHGAEVLLARFSPDGEMVITASADHSARIWNSRTGEALTAELQHEDRVVSAEFSPDGKRVATASADKTARIWDARTGEALTDSLRHKEGVNCVRFSADGRQIITASADATARVWDVESGQPVTEWLRHDAAINSAEFSPDGQRVVTASADHTARVWELPTTSLPVPEWLPRLADALAGQRLNSQGVPEPVPAGEVLRLKAELVGNAATDGDARWVKWFFADRSARAISPNSSISVPEYVQRRTEYPRNYRFAATEPFYVPGYVRNQSQRNRLNSLEEAVRMAPTNAWALARLARALLDNPIVLKDSRQKGDADWYSRRALALARDNLEVMWARAEVLARSGRLEEALGEINRAIQREPHNPEFWNAKGRMLETTNRLEEARQAYSQAIEFAAANEEPAAQIRAKALLNRYEVLRKLGRPAEARADLLAAKAEMIVPVTIARRNPKNRPELIDLSPHIDVLLTETWNWWRGAAKKSDYGAAPRGLCTLEGVPVDLRGYVYLRRYQDSISGQSYPDQVTEIIVGQGCKRIHILHAASGTGIPAPPHGTQIGQYVIHYVNGQKEDVAIRFGYDIAELVDWAPEENARYVTAWAGTNERVKQYYPAYKSIRILKMTWENPHPDWQIKSLDAIAEKANLLLFAITAE